MEHHRGRRQGPAGARGALCAVLPGGPRWGPRGVRRVRREVPLRPQLPQARVRRPPPLGSWLRSEPVACAAEACACLRQFSRFSHSCGLRGLLSRASHQPARPPTRAPSSYPSRQVRGRAASRTGAIAEASGAVAEACAHRRAGPRARWCGAAHCESVDWPDLPNCPPCSITACLASRVCLVAATARRCWELLAYSVSPPVPPLPAAPAPKQQAAAATPPPGPAKAAEAAAALDHAAHEVAAAKEAANTEITLMRRQLAATQQSLADAEKQLSGARTDLSAEQARALRAEADLAEAKQRVAELETELREAAAAEKRAAAAAAAAAEAKPAGSWWR